MLQVRSHKPVTRHADDVFVIIIEDAGKRRPDQKKDNESDAHHGTFIFLEPPPGLLTQGPPDHFSAVCLFLVEQSHIFIPFRSTAL